MQLNQMNMLHSCRTSDRYIISLTLLCSFWNNLSCPAINFLGARFTCNRSYCYAFRRTEQTDSLRFSQHSAFPQNIQVKRRH